MRLRRDTKVYFILAIIIILIIIVIFWTKGNGKITEKEAICIGGNSELYTRSGCPACEKQEEMFGDYYNHLIKIDCADEPQRCEGVGITGTPTWFIDGQEYRGVQSIEKLKELTGC